MLQGTPAGRRFVGLTISLLLPAGVALAQPDYPPAHWVPATNCTKYYTTGNGHSFCVIHDMEGYYWTSISYLNRCDISASVHYLANGLQNGSDSLGHRENRPDDPAAGDLTQSVREEHYAWHARCWNRYMFGTEHEGFVSSPVWFSRGDVSGFRGVAQASVRQLGHPQGPEPHHRARREEERELGGLDEHQLAGH